MLARAIGPKQKQLVILFDAGWYHQEVFVGGGVGNLGWDVGEAILKDKAAAKLKEKLPDKVLEKYAAVAETANNAVSKAIKTIGTDMPLEVEIDLGEAPDLEKLAMATGGDWQTDMLNMAGYDSEGKLDPTIDVATLMARFDDDCSEADVVVNEADEQQIAEQKHFKPDYAIIGEPTGMVPVIMHKGHMSEGIRITGKSGHSSTPDNGLNAIDLMHLVL